MLFLEKVDIFLTSYELIQIKNTPDEILISIFLYCLYLGHLLDLLHMIFLHNWSSKYPNFTCFITGQSIPIPHSEPFSH